jgi:methionyl-tRNA formyltransferase
LKIIFYGTPFFAVPTLEKLVNSGLDVVAVVTAPDKPSGRGLKLSESPVKKAALSFGIPVLQPVKMSDPVFVETLNNINPDLQVVVAFRYLPRAVWSVPSKGTFNLHASLLPQYRGAAPINWAIINGETISGLTTFFIDDAIDTGKLLFSEPINIGSDETAGELHDRMMLRGSELVLKTVLSVSKGEISPVDQVVPLGASALLKMAPKLSKDLCRINWEKPVEVVCNLVRGLSPYPAAFTLVEIVGKTPFLAKIMKAKIHQEEHSLYPGTIQTDGKRFFRVATQDAFIEIIEIQPEGKRSMEISAFLNGLQFDNHTMTGFTAGKCS